MKKFRWHEVVRVDAPIFLVTSRHRACRYETCDGKPLAPGYYLALWPSRVSHTSYSRELRYFGPFAALAEAQLLQSSALALGIVELDITARVPVIPAESNDRHGLPADGGLLHAIGCATPCT